MRILTAFILLCIIFFGFSGNPLFERKEKLSDYNFFKGQLSELIPNTGIIPYDVNSALFSNYAEKSRFLKIPSGKRAVYDDSSIFEFPKGTILIKNFYYPYDFRNPAKGKKIIETRLLVHEESGWQAYPYIWNETQADAFYDPAGETTSVTYINHKGKKINSPYVIPNKNQCKGCHTNRGKMKPIGTTARQLNRELIIENQEKNQLQYWKELTLLNEVQLHMPKLAVWNDRSTGTLNDRARAYLDTNCAHCHSRWGPANTSGLFLDIYEMDPTHLGVNKAPVAAGRGAGNFQFDIKPGEPHNSILTFRMKTNDPAIAMPEIGRENVHEEGVALIEEWIRKNTFVKK